MATQDARRGAPRVPREARRRSGGTRERRASSSALVARGRGAVPRLPARRGARAGRSGPAASRSATCRSTSPRELLHAQGVLPVGILGGGDDLEIIRGDAYYQSYICHIPRSTIELGLNGSLDCLDGMLFPAICDVIRNLSGMWKMQFPDKLVALPRRAAGLRPRDRRRASTRTSWTSLRGELERARRAAATTPEALRASIARLQREPRARARALRAAPRRALEGARRASSTWCCARAWSLPVEEHTAMLERLPRAVEADERAPADGPGARGADRAPSASSRRSA